MKLLVIARKTNDIVYSMLTPVWKEADHKEVIIIANSKIKEGLPFLNLFDKVYYLNPSNEQNILLRVCKDINALINLIPSQKIDTICLSNPFMTVNQYIIKRTHCSNIIWVEDGLMNYYEYESKNGIRKKFIQSILGIHELKTLSKISSTFLWKPEMAHTYLGERKKFQSTSDFLRKDIPRELLNKLRGKRIFVGQNYYAPQYNIMTFKEYNNTINKIIQEYNIDFYFPHPFSSQDEKINCKIIDTGSVNLTLEMLATLIDFQVFSINSTVLFSTKLINPKCKNVAVVPKFIESKISIPEIIRCTCTIRKMD